MTRYERMFGSIEQAAKFLSLEISCFDCPLLDRCDVDLNDGIHSCENQFKRFLSEEDA